MPLADGLYATTCNSSGQKNSSTCLYRIDEMLKPELLDNRIRNDSHPAVEPRTMFRI